MNKIIIIYIIKMYSLCGVSIEMLVYKSECITNCIFVVKLAEHIARNISV